MSYSKVILQFFVLLVFWVCLSCNNTPTSPRKTSRVRITSTDSLEADQDTAIYRVLPIMPIFLSCEEEDNQRSQRQCTSDRLIKYLYENIQYESPPQDKGIFYTKTIVQFVIEKDGSISNVKVSRDQMISNIKELLQNMPKWKAGRKDGYAKRFEYSFPIRVHLE
ncbi:MAG: hypothetical protein AB8F74_14595 [Saprospiraceae bacterium]